MINIKAIIGIIVLAALLIFAVFIIGSPFKKSAAPPSSVSDEEELKLLEELNKQIGSKFPDLSIPGVLPSSPKLKVDTTAHLPADYEAPTKSDYIELNRSTTAPAK